MKKIVWFALCLLTLSWGSYLYHFSSLGVSTSQEHWGLLGDFIGGVSNPILTFLTIIILVASLRVQKKEVEEAKRFEQVRSFESHFFNMIQTQKVIFENFRLLISTGETVLVKRSGAAVIAIEEVVVHFKDSQKNEDDIKLALNELDKEDDIYTVIRSFCVIVKMLDKKLSDKNGFSSSERQEYYEILISYTDYPLVRLVLVAIKYLDYAQLDILRENKDFILQLREVGADDYLDSV